MKKIFFLVLLTACASYKIPTSCLTEDHPLYHVIPRHRCQIRWYDLGHFLTWALFGNDDDGLFGKKPATLVNALKWQLRNPLHNFCFYVIGSAERKNEEWALININNKGVSTLHHHKTTQRNFGSKTGSSFFLALHGGKPYLSLRLFFSKTRSFDCYLGWRERGNFGLKITSKTREPEASVEQLKIDPRCCEFRQGNGAKPIAEEKSAADWTYFQLFGHASGSRVC